MLMADAVGDDEGAAEAYRAYLILCPDEAAFLTAYFGEATIQA